MNDHTYETMFLGRPARVVGAYAYVHLSREIEVTFDHVTVHWMNRLFPTGLLRLHGDGKGRCYVDVRCQAGCRDRLSAARIVLCLLGIPEQKNRQAHYRDGNTYNLASGNPHFGEAGYYAGGDATWQEIARRRWLEEQGKNPDKTLAKIIEGTPQPPNKGMSNEGVPPVHPTSRACPRSEINGTAGGRR